MNIEEESDHQLDYMIDEFEELLNTVQSPNYKGSEILSNTERVKTLYEILCKTLEKKTHLKRSTSQDFDSPSPTSVQKREFFKKRPILKSAASLILPNLEIPPSIEESSESERFKNTFIGLAKNMG